MSVVNNQLSLKQIRLEKNLDVHLPQIKVDTNQMQQVFINLVVNAADAIGENGGMIKITSNTISLSSYGVKHIKKAVCPKRHDLIDNEIKIEGLPTIRVKINSNGMEGLLNLDAVYGRHRHQYGIDVKKGKTFRISCPKCNVSLMQEEIKCPRCNSQTFTFEVPLQGMFEACVNPDCTWERWAEVDVAGYKDFAEIKISDSGSGIRKEDLPKIFEPFYSTKGQSGTGLGLAVIWGIIDNHNGTIGVDSEVGKGTTFTIRLPI